MDNSPFHRGEQQAQQRMGVREEIEPWARQVIRPFLPDQHQAFFAQLPYLIVAGRDSEARPWVTMLTGMPGFVHAPNPRQLAIAAQPVAGDALATSMQPGAELGLLGIELHTRRRNRANGRVATTADGSLKLDITQSFGNCPQHIHERNWSQVERTDAPWHRYTPRCWTHRCSA